MDMRITCKGNAADTFNVQGRSFEVQTGPVQEWAGRKTGVLVHPAREAKGELTLREFAHIHRLAARLVRMSPNVRHHVVMGSANMPDTIGTLEIEVGNSPSVTYQFTPGRASTPCVTELLDALGDVQMRLLPGLPGRGRAVN